MAVRSSVVAALGAKVVAGGAVAALAAGGATAAIAATGSLSPVNWGQHVVQAVERCKDELRGTQETAAGGPDRGIGQCVSAVARQHGQQQGDQHAGPSGQAVGPSPSAEPGKHLGQIKNGSLPAPAAAPPGHGKGQSQSRGQGGGNGNGAANGKGNK